MPRQPRLDAPGALHHVMGRGIERTKVFHGDTDRDDFVNRLAVLCRDRSLVVYAWALMPNHVPLIGVPETERVTQGESGEFAITVGGDYCITDDRPRAFGLEELRIAPFCGILLAEKQEKLPCQQRWERGEPTAAPIGYR